MKVNEYLKDVDKMVHYSIMEEDKIEESFIPRYTKDIASAMNVAEKVKLFDATIMVKRGVEWFFFYKGIEQQSLFEESGPIDFMDLQPMAMGHSLPEAICRASLVLMRSRNEQSSSTNQQCNREPAKADS